MLYVNPLDSPFAARANGILNSSARGVTAFREMEHFFAYMLLQEMQKTVPKGGLFDDGLQSDFQRDLFNDIVSGKIAESGQLGIAKQIQEQLRIQDMQKRLLGGAAESKPTA